MQLQGTVARHDRGGPGIGLVLTLLEAEAAGQFVVVSAWDPR